MKCGSSKKVRGLCQKWGNFRQAEVRLAWDWLSRMLPVQMGMIVLLSYSKERAADTGILSPVDEYCKTSG